MTVTLLRRYRDILPSTHWLLVPAMATGRERTWPPGMNLARDTQAKGRPSQGPMLQGRGLGPPCWPEAHLWGLGCEWGWPGNLGGHEPHPHWRAPLETGSLLRAGCPPHVLDSREQPFIQQNQEVFSGLSPGPTCCTLSPGLGVKMGFGESGCRPRLSPPPLSKCPIVFGAPSSGLFRVPGGHHLPLPSFFQRFPECLEISSLRSRLPLFLPQ